MLRYARAPVSLIGFATASLVLSCCAVRADFLLRHEADYPHRILHDATLVHVYGEGLLGISDPLFTEAVTAFTLSADRQRVHVFGNDLGEVTDFSFDLHTGAYLEHHPISGSGVGVPGVAGLQTNVGISSPLLRTHDPYGNGDLVYVAYIWGGPDDGSQIINLVNSSSHDLLGQIELPSPGDIYDIAFADGSLGPESRLYVAASNGFYVYDELPGQSAHPFGLAFTLPLPGMQTYADISIGPDGYLYVMNGPTPFFTSAIDVRRYDAQTGALVDVVVPGGTVGSADHYMTAIDFGPGGDLYVAVNFEDELLTAVNRYDTVSTQLRASYDLSSRGLSSHELQVVADPLPEPSSVVLLAICGALFYGRKRIALLRG